MTGPMLHTVDVDSDAQTDLRSHHHAGWRSRLLDIRLRRRAGGRLDRPVRVPISARRPANADR